MALKLRTKRKSTTDKSRVIRAFNALGDATRFKLVHLLARKEELCVSELAEEIGITTAGASQHLKILEQAGLVDRNRMGQKICYSIKNDNKENKQILDVVLGD